MRALVTGYTPQQRSGGELPHALRKRCKTNIFVVRRALGGNVTTDAFGLVALVAMMPLITVQAMGGIYVLKSKRGAEGRTALPYAEGEIIELWEAC